MPSCPRLRISWTSSACAIFIAFLHPSRSHSLALPHAIWTTSDVKPSGGVSIRKISHYDLSILVIAPTPGPILRRRYLRPASQDLVTHTPPSHSTYNGYLPGSGSVVDESLIGLHYLPPHPLAPSCVTILSYDAHELLGYQLYDSATRVPTHPYLRVVQVNL